MSKSFDNLSSTEDFNNLLVVDGLNLAFRYKHLGKDKFAEDYVRTVHSFAKSYKSGKIIITGDGGSDYRYALLDTYKISRKDLKDNQTEKEAKEFEDFLSEVNRAFNLLNLKHPVLRYKGVEADDIAAYISKYYSENFEHIWLISSDRDWDLLINNKVSRFSFRTRKEITINNWNSHYNYEPQDHISIKVLQGDKGDDIPGVPGIGDKRAATLIKQHGSALDIYEKLPLPGDYVYIKNLNAFGDKILLNYELMDLLTYCEDAIGSNIDDIEEKLQEYFNGS